ncbi:hypothetical protein D3C87_1521760 [compost metagenome]
MRIGHEQPRHEIFLAGGHARAALAAAVLRPIGRKRHAFDIAGMADGDDHVLAGDQVLVVEIGSVIADLGAARRTELLANGFEFLADDGADALAAAQNIEIVFDLGAQAIEFVADFVAAQGRETGEAQFENGARLLFGKVERTVIVDAVARIVDQLDQRRHVGRRPAPGHQLLACCRRIGRGADERYDFVDIGHGHGQAN